MRRSCAAGALAAALSLSFVVPPFANAYADGVSVDRSAIFSNDTSADSIYFIGESGNPDESLPAGGEPSDADSKSLNDASLSLEFVSHEYTGKAIEPRVTVAYNGKLLVEGSDYFIAYEDNVAPGLGKVLVTGLGLFSGSEVQASFDIVRSDGNLIALPGNWRLDNIGWWYAYSDGGCPKSCILIIDGVPYRFDDRGYMYSGWYVFDGQWHYSYPNGAVATGWAYVGGAWYYLSLQSGAMQTGWAYIGEHWYYLDSSGAMRTGWLNLGGSWYWLDSSGAMGENWEFIDGSWYYFSSDGAMRTGWVLVGDEWYFLSGSGAMQTGWLQRYGVWYYLSGSGAMAKGRCAVSNVLYVFNADGAMQTGWVLCSDGWVYASASGALESGWLLIGSHWYWLDPQNDNIMVVGLREISGSLYKFEADGQMVARAWFDVGDGRAAHASASGAIDLYGSYDEQDNVICAFDSGERYVGWEKLGSSWFYFDDEGFFEVGWKHVDGSWYYFYSDGSMATGWVLDGQKWYYLQSSGAMVTGWNTIDSTYYQFGADGALREAEPAAITDIQRRLVSACNSVGSPGPGLCSEWVAMVFSRIGQGQNLPNNDYDADDMFYAYCNLDDLSELRVGMIIAVPSHTHTYMGSIYGHICIYVGNNTVMDNVGRIRTMSLGEWLSYYTTNHSPKWGWYNHYALE